MTATPPDKPRYHQVGVAAVHLKESGINRLRFSSCEDLLDAGAVLVDETGRSTLGGARQLLMVQTTRATHTFESVIALCRIGRGIQAAMLNRSLLEDALDVHWVAANPQDAPGFADEHEEMMQLAERAEFESFARADVRPLDVSERETLKRLLKLCGGIGASWTRASVDHRIRLIKTRWDSEASGCIDQTYKLIQRQNNLLLRSSPSALGLAMNPGRRGPNRADPDPWWRQALAHGVLGYYVICRVLADEFGFSKNALLDAYLRAGRFSRQLDREQVEGLRSGDACPCESSLPFGSCNGS